MAEGITATDYALTDDQADWLAGMVSLPSDFRRQVADAIIARHGAAYLAEMFAQFIGLANSVVANNRDWLEIAAIVPGGLHPNEAEKMNTPTIFGAVVGAKLAKHGCEQACSGCAFRIGTHANQSASTTLDAEWCGHPGEATFMCHEGIDEAAGDQPTKPCFGWVRLRQAMKARETA